MNKSEVLQNMAIDRMGEDIAIIASDVSQLNLDVITIREEIKELREIVKGWRKNKNGKEN